MKRALRSITIGLSGLLAPVVFASQPTQPQLFNPVILSANLGSELPALPSNSSVNDKTRMRINQAYGDLPLQFVANAGQTDRQVKFLTRGSGYSMFFTPTESVLVLSKSHENSSPQTTDQGGPLPESSTSHSKVQSTTIRMRLEGANPAPRMFGEDILPGKSNYLLGNDPKKWRTNVSNYKKVRYQEVYLGIDLVYYGNQRKLEYDFVVKPGADPKTIRMQFAGVDRMSVEAGDLVMHTDSGNMIQKAPIIYQEMDGQRKKVPGNYMFLANNQMGFYLGDYDTTQPLVIDPVLQFSTYFGGNNADQPFGLALDNAGNVYVSGWTNSTNFPAVTPLPGGGAFTGGFRDAFVSKLKSTGTSLLFFRR